MNELEELRAELEKLSLTEKFQMDMQSLSKEEKIEYAYELMACVMKTAGLKAEDVRNSMDRLLVVMESPVMNCYIGLSPLLASHYNLCLGTIMDMGGGWREDLQGYVRDLEAGKTLGIYIVTETDCGNNAMSMRTTAVYDDESGEFILSSDSAAAYKFMPYLSMKKPKLAIVMARLIVRDEDCGVHPFVVQCRDESGELAAGVKASGPCVKLCNSSLRQNAQICVEKA